MLLVRAPVLSSCSLAVVCGAAVPVRQVEVALARLKDASLDHDDHLVCLEALARLAWSDDSVRQVRACVCVLRGLSGGRAVRWWQPKSSTPHTVCFVHHVALLLGLAHVCLPRS